MNELEILEQYQLILERAAKYAEAHPPSLAGINWKWSLKRVYWDQNSFTADWSRYMGCGDWEEDQTFFTLDDIKEQA